MIGSNLASLRTLACVAPFLAVACGAPVELAPTDAGLAEDAAKVDAATDAASEPEPVAYLARVVSYAKGEKGGYGEDALPDVILGPPKGGGCCAGSLDVLSLGNGGEVVVAFDVDVVDGPGTDFVVFENAFEIGGDETSILAEPAEVAVSEDGVGWIAFPCTATSYPYGACAGWHPVYATESSPIDPRAPEKAGGDPFDLASIGVKRARFLRIRDMNAKFPAAEPTAGFDLDAVVALHFDAKVAAPSAAP